MRQTGYVAPSWVFQGQCSNSEYSKFMVAVECPLVCRRVKATFSEDGILAFPSVILGSAYNDPNNSSNTKGRVHNRHNSDIPHVAHWDDFRPLGRSLRAEDETGLKTCTVGYNFKKPTCCFTSMTLKVTDEDDTSSPTALHELSGVSDGAMSTAFSCHTGNVDICQHYVT
jgi:hypothetical protein